MAARVKCEVALVAVVPELCNSSEQRTSELPRDKFTWKWSVSWRLRPARYPEFPQSPRTLQSLQVLA